MFNREEENVLKREVDIRKPPFLNPDQFKFVLNKNNIFETILLTLSNLPIIGWGFDFFLALYALKTKNLKLGLLTFLGWIVFGFGPVFKAFYLFDNQQQVSKVMSTTTNKEYVPEYDNYDKARLEEIMGKKYLAKKDKKGEIQLYEPVINEPKSVGILDPMNGTIKYKN